MVSYLLILYRNNNDNARGEAKKMKNTDIREMIKAAGLKHWQVAEAAGISHGTLCVWLRSDLTEERRDTVLLAIERIKREGLYGCR